MDCVNIDYCENCEPGMHRDCVLLRYYWPREEGDRFAGGVLGRVYGGL
jgi:hypothetical protein